MPLTRTSYDWIVTPGEPHPIQWTRKLDAKTVNRRLTEEQWRGYQAWFDNTRRLRALVSELERTSLEIFEQDDRWPRR